MTPIEKIRREIEALSDKERREIIIWLLSKPSEPKEAGSGMDSTTRGIEITPGVCGGEPRIVRTRIPVWVLDEMRRQGSSDAEILSSFPTLIADDLTNAWAYAAAHPEEIESQIRENQEA
jgi:uncharacterized protein (DUF433 family)